LLFIYKIKLIFIIYYKKINMKGFALDGHALSLKFSHGASSNTNNANNNKRKYDKHIEPNSTKLIIRNIPFEATKKDLRELFR